MRQNDFSIQSTRSIRRASVLLCTFAFLVQILLLAGCATTQTVQKQTAKLIERQERMFWEIQGTDSQGNPSTVYIQGTIHLADEKIYPIDSSVLALWDSADRIVGEISTDGWANYMQDLQNRMIKSSETAAGRDIRTSLTEKELNYLNTTLGKEAVDQFSLFEPWVLTTSLSQVLFTQTGLQTAQSYDMYFIAKAQETKRNMEGLDQLSVQMDFLQFGTWEQQMVLLKDSIEALLNPEESVAELHKLYEAYVANDKKALAEIEIAEMKTGTAKDRMYKDYYKALYGDRNKEWAVKIKQWLDDGGTTFIFAGCGHFTGADTVFDYMRKAKTIQ